MARSLPWLASLKFEVGSFGQELEMLGWTDLLDRVGAKLVFAVVETGAEKLVETGVGRLLCLSSKKEHLCSEVSSSEALSRPQLTVVWWGNLMVAETVANSDVPQDQSWAVPRVFHWAVLRVFAMEELLGLKKAFAKAGKMGIVLVSLLDLMLAVMKGVMLAATPAGKTAE